jgi:nuclear pore complex protein Nup98-Nup96
MLYPDPQNCIIIIIIVAVGKYCCRPVPAYLELVGGADEEEEGVGGPLDIKYHLLRLYADRSHSLESLLSPASHTPDQLDTRLSWLLYQVCA